MNKISLNLVWNCRLFHSTAAICSSKHQQKYQQSVSLASLRPFRLSRWQNLFLHSSKNSTKNLQEYPISLSCRLANHLHFIYTSTHVSNNLALLIFKISLILHFKYPPLLHLFLKCLLMPCLTLFRISAFLPIVSRSNFHMPHFLTCVCPCIVAYA